MLMTSSDVIFVSLAVATVISGTVSSLCFSSDNDCSDPESCAYIITTVDEGMCCSGYKACYSSWITLRNTINDRYIRCMGYESCALSLLETENSDMWINCEGAYSCPNSIIYSQYSGSGGGSIFAYGVLSLLNSVIRYETNYTYSDISTGYNALIICDYNTFIVCNGYCVIDCKYSNNSSYNINFDSCPWSTLSSTFIFCIYLCEHSCRFGEHRCRFY